MAQTSPIQETSQESSHAKIYGLEMPNPDFAISSLSRLLGKAEAQKTWKQAAKACNVTHDIHDPANLKLVYQHLAKKSGAIGVLGRSLSVRLSSYVHIQEADKNDDE